MADTIFALSSGSLPSGVAVIRVSGPTVREICLAIVGETYDSHPRKVCPFLDPLSGTILDKGIFLFFVNPHSFTGEDVCEFHCHGGAATVERFLVVLGSFPNTRMADAGEFSKRAFENGKMDLTAVEGLSDLLAAQTEAQRQQALSQSSGSLFTIYDDWRSDLIQCRALIDVSFDFSDEGDVEGDVANDVWVKVDQLISALRLHLDDNRRGELVRDGFHIALMGPPNSGKSSLLNALARRDVAIVTDQAGTTRDVLSVSLDLGGNFVVVSDTAGIRDSNDAIEQEGIRRSFLAAKKSDLVLWLVPVDETPGTNQIDGSVLVRSKSDLITGFTSDDIFISTTSNDGADQLINFITRYVLKTISKTDGPTISRARHRLQIEATLRSLMDSQNENLLIEVRSEFLREASNSLGRLCGTVDVEDLLDVIFSDFCIGK